MPIQHRAIVRSAVRTAFSAEVFRPQPGHPSAVFRHLGAPHNVARAVMRGVSKVAAPCDRRKRAVYQIVHSTGHRLHQRTLSSASRAFLIRCAVGVGVQC